MTAAENLVALLTARGLTCAVAESCTGGAVGGAICAVPGASAAFLGGVVSYADSVKRDVLRVPVSVLTADGAVSAACAEAMARGVRALLHADLAVSVTGIAGPGGGTVGKPVGLVWFGLAAEGGVRSEKKLFAGDRAAVRAAATEHALGMLSAAAMPAAGQAAAPRRFPLELDRPLVVFDIESTGLDPREDRIVELAAVKIHPDGREETKCWLLNPERPIPPETTKIHGISDSIVKDCRTFAEASMEIDAFFAGCDVGGFNCDRFDVPCLEAEFKRTGRDFDSSWRRHVDAQRIFHGQEPRDLSAAVRFYCGRDHAGAHGAEADACATRDVLAAMLDRYPELPRTTAALDERLVPHDPQNADRQGMIRWIDGAWRINFGKKRGKTLESLFLTDKSYLDWAARGKFPDDFRAICAKLLDHGVLPPPPGR